MANELNITQDFRTMTLNLPTDMVTIHLVVKTLKGQYGFCQNNNHSEACFNRWSEDLQPTESFMKVVRETQIKPDKFYLENAMHQSLYKNYAFNSYMPKVTVIEQLPPQENNDENRQTQSLCPSNWSDYLHVADDSSDDEKPKQTDQSTDQPTTLTGTRVPQDIWADANTTVRLPQTVPQAQKRQKQNGKTKQKTRPPYATWTWEKSQKQDDPEQK